MWMMVEWLGYLSSYLSPLALHMTSYDGHVLPPPPSASALMTMIFILSSPNARFLLQPCYIRLHDCRATIIAIVDRHSSQPLSAESLGLMSIHVRGMTANIDIKSTLTVVCLVLEQCKLKHEASIP